MAIAAFNGQAQDLNGNAVTAFQVEVRDETDGTLAPIFSDLAGMNPLGNPFTPNPLDNGHFIFYVEQGRYRIRAFTVGGDVADWRNVTIGLDTTITDDLYLGEADNLSDVDTPATAFDNIKQPASVANIRSSTGDDYVSAEAIEDASAVVALTDAATIAFDWDTGINFQVTLTTNRVLGNPTNGQPGTWRTVLVKSDGGPDTLTFGNQYGGEVPTIDDVTTSQFYLLMIYCKTSTQFLVSAIDGSDA